MTKETAQFNGGEQAVVAYAYDELGQLSGKTYGTGQHAIHETMDYNMQGWLTEKSSELFDMQLRYFEPYRDWLEPYYSGNIASWIWQHKLINNVNDDEEYAYGYRYDDLSRLTAAEQFYWDMEGPNDDWTENGIAYDKNSNIITLNRSSVSSEDTRSYRFSYNGNQRVKETNSNSAYGYDANGNISSDALSGLEISYNLLNLPSESYGGGDYSDYYDYLADGTKVQHEYSDGQQDEYRGSLVYYSNGEFSAPFGGGRLVSEGNTTAAHYFLTDHLGSTRVVAKVTPTGRIDLDRKDYYPFGKEWKQSGMPTSSNAFLFSGKERQHSEGYDGAITSFYDFGARFYDSDGVHFLQQDPLLEKYFRIGQYNYCAGNPVKFIDRDGRDIRITYNTTTKSGRTVAAYATYSQGNITYTQGATPTTVSKEFVQQVQADLNQLAADNPILAARIETLENSDHIHTIEQSAHYNGNTPESVENDKDGIPTGSTTAYNPNLESTPSAGERPARAGLAHELLGHGYDSDQGKTNHQKTSNGIPMSEVNAVNTENLVRKASNIPIRTTYDDKPIPHKLLQDPQP